MNNDLPKLIPAGEVKARLGGVSDMALWRWLRDERIKFPRPIVIGRRRYWDEAELTAFIRSRRISA